MRYGVTYNQLGQVLPAGLHVPVNNAAYPYVPHPLMLTGHIPVIPALGSAPISPQRSPTLTATAYVNPGPHSAI